MSNYYIDEEGNKVYIATKAVQAAQEAEEAEIADVDEVVEYDLGTLPPGWQEPLVPKEPKKRVHLHTMIELLWDAQEELGRTQKERMAEIRIALDEVPSSQHIYNALNNAKKLEKRSKENSLVARIHELHKAGMPAAHIAKKLTEELGVEIKYQRVYNALEGDIINTPTKKELTAAAKKASA